MATAWQDGVRSAGVWVWGEHAYCHDRAALGGLEERESGGDFESSLGQGCEF